MSEDRRNLLPWFSSAFTLVIYFWPFSSYQGELLETSSPTLPPFALPGVLFPFLLTVFSDEPSLSFAFGLMCNSVYIRYLPYIVPSYSYYISLRIVFGVPLCEFVTESGDLLADSAFILPSALLQCSGMLTVPFKIMVQVSISSKLKTRSDDSSFFPSLSVTPFTILSDHSVLH